MRGGWLIVALGLALAGAGAAAQQAGPLKSPVVTLDQDRLFAESQFGRAIMARAETQNRELEAEFRKIEAALEAEEQSLTVLRASLSAIEFRRLADEFDARAEDVRQAQEAKSRALLRRQDEERKTFFQAALPIVGELMRDRGAVAIVNREAIVLAFDWVDITDAAIARLNAELGDGAKAGLEPSPEPEPEPTPDPAPTP